MSKVLVTTPRIGSWMKNYEVKRDRRRVKSGDYDLPRYSSMKPKGIRWGERKSLNEYLNPLIRFLNKSVGKLWDDIYSDICKNMDKRTPVQAHIFQHLYDFVELNPVIINNIPHHPISGYDGTYREIYKDEWSFYVDDKGFLKKGKRVRPPWDSRKQNPNVIKTKDESIFYIRRESDGVWFGATLKENPNHDFSLSLFIKERNPDWAAKLLGRSVVLNKKIILKTLSRKEKRRLKLS